jgi:hypothetical protein
MTPGPTRPAQPCPRTSRYKKEAKERLAPWVIRTYTLDNYTGPPPVTESPTRTSYKDAGRIARMALRELEQGAERADATRPVVYYPLGLEQRRVRAYKVIKPSAFLFRTPVQRAKFVKAADKFFDETGCGLELLALRRSSPDRRQGSVRDVATIVYSLIRAGEENITRALNLTRPFDGREIGVGHRRELDDRKAAETARIIRQIDARWLTEDEKQTGWFVSQSEVILVE